MRLTFFLLFTGLMLAFGCNKKVSETSSSAKATSSDERTAGPVKTITYGALESLKITETCKVEKSDVTFTFVDVVSDSRCPNGVDCIQAGEAVVLVQASGQSPQRITIDTDPKTTVRMPIGGGTLEILALNPYPDARIRIDPAQRALQIRVVKGEKMR